MKTATDYKAFDRFFVYDDLQMQLNNRAKWPVNNIFAIPMDTNGMAPTSKLLCL